MTSSGGFTAIFEDTLFILFKYCFFIYCSGLSIVHVEQVNAGWLLVRATSTEISLWIKRYSK